MLAATACCLFSFAQLQQKSTRLKFFFRFFYFFSYFRCTIAVETQLERLFCGLRLKILSQLAGEESVDAARAKR